MLSLLEIRLSRTGGDERMRFFNSQYRGRQLDDDPQVFEFESIQRVSLNPAASPGIVNEGAKMTNLLGDGCRRFALRLYAFHPAKKVIQSQAPKLYAGLKRVCNRQHATVSAAHVSHAPGRKASHLGEIVQKPFCYGI